MSCQGDDLNLSPNLRFTSGNATENLRYFEQRYGELEVKARPEDPNGDYVVACHQVGPQPNFEQVGWPSCS